MKARQNNRDSNIELARIVAMAMIVIWHFILHGLQGEDRFLAIDSFGPLHADQYIQLGISTLCIVGVNLFVLISGFYKIKLKWKSILNYYLLCMFWNAVILAISCAYQSVSPKDIINVFFISKMSNWFFRAYFILLLVSPILNYAMAAFSIKQFRIIVLILLILTCVSGWLFHNGNSDGYNAYQLLTIYVFGGYIAKEEFFNKIKSGQALLLFFAFSALNYISMMAVYYLFGKEITTLLHYNYLLLILQSVSLFCFFKQMKLKSPAVNIVASTVVAALFVQQAIEVPLYAYIHSDYMSNGFTGKLFLFLAAVFIAIFIVAFVIEGLRKKFMKPIVDRLSDKLDSIVDISFN